MQQEIDQLTTCRVVGLDGEEIGNVVQVYLDDRTGHAEWVTVRTGLFGMRQTFVPLANAKRVGSDLHVPYAKSMIKDAPNIDAGQSLTTQQEVELYRYYGMPVPGSAGQAGHGQEMVQTASADGQSDAPELDEVVMVRAEERMHVDTERLEASRVRLRKYVITEEVEQNVPLLREEVEIERIPITEEPAGEHLEIGEAEHEIILHVERPVVTKTTVAVERVRVLTKAIQDQETVRGEIRKEQIDVERSDRAELEHVAMDDEY